MRLKPLINTAKNAKSAGVFIPFDLDTPAADFVEKLKLTTMD